MNPNLLAGACLLFAHCLIPFASAQDQDANPSKMTSQTLRELIAEGELDRAAKLLDEAIDWSVEETVESSLVQVVPELAMAFVRARDYPSAIDYYRKAAEFGLRHLDRRVGQTLFNRSWRTLHSLMRRDDQAEQANALLDRGIEKLLVMQSQEAWEANPAMTGLLTQLIRTRVGLGDLSDPDREKYLQVIHDQLQRLVQFHEQNPDDEIGIVNLADMYETASVGMSHQPAKAAELASLQMDLLQAQLESKLQSRRIASAYATAVQSRIARTYRDDPDAAEALIQDSEKLLQQADDQLDGALEPLIARISAYKSRVDSARKMRALIGQPAPAMDVDAWVNNRADIDLNALKGKVVLLDYWAVWCGPCIATFPHLKEWREEFHEQGFEIVGVTRYYNYRWDDDAQRAVRSEEDVPPEQEQLTVASFMQHHGLQHPCIITPQGSEMQAAYGVTGIPHAVVIDRSGTIQMIKVGSGEANAKALHAKIEELLAVPAEN